MEQSSNKSMIAAVIAIIVLIGGGIGIYALTQNNSEEEPTTTQQVTEEPQEEAQAEPAEQDIVSLASETEALSTLVLAVETANLVETLQGDGPFTVLAPTNDAFAAALAALNITAEELLAREDLADILTYHVIAGRVLSSDLSDGQVVTTVQGGTLTVDITDEGVFFVDANNGRAQVATADVTASNGVVHVIDAVLLP